MERRSPKSHMVKTKMPMGKSHVARSPMPKSPMPKSPIPRSPVAYEKYKSRCAYGLISFFSFRHRYSKKMISDTYGRSLSRHSLDDQPRHSDQFNIHDVMDGKFVTVDYSKSKMKNIKSELCTEQQPKKKITTAKVENVQSDSEHAQDQLSKHKKAAKACQRRRSLPIYGCYDVSTSQHANSTLRVVAERSLNSLDSNSRSNGISLEVNPNEAIEAFINQKLIDGRHISRDGSSHESKHFLAALVVLNSNKDLFVKLLQDPNSVLVKHIEDLRDSREKEQKEPLLTEFELLEHQISSHPKDCDCQPLENIVLLKPQLNSLHHCTKITSPESPQFQSFKPAIFTLEQMKRKLMQVMRVRRKKKQSLLSVGQNIEDMDSRNLPDKEASDLMDAKRKTQMHKEESNPGVIDDAGLDCERGLEISCLSPTRSPRTEKHDFYVEPRRDIPDYDCLHMIGPGRTRGNGSVSPKRMFPPYASVKASPHQKKMDVLDNLYLDVGENQRISLSHSSFGEIETSIDEDLERFSSSGMTCELDSPHNDGVNRSNEMVDTCEESPSLTSPRTDAILEKTQTSNRFLHDCFSSPSNICSFEEFDEIKDNTEQPSPISVLDQFFTEPEQVFVSAHQSEVTAKVHDSVTSTEELLDYIGQVLEASHFTWDDLSQECQISDQILDQMVFEGIHDCRLLFDYVNEVVLDAYSCYSSCSPWLSFIKPDIAPSMSTSGITVHEIMKHVDRELVLAQNPEALDKIIETDLSKSRRWMDIRLYAEDTVCEIIDQLLEELTVEFAVW